MVSNRLATRAMPGLSRISPSRPKRSLKTSLVFSLPQCTRKYKRMIVQDACLSSFSNGVRVRSPKESSLVWAMLRLPMKLTGRRVYSKRVRKSTALSERSRAWLRSPLQTCWAFSGLVLIGRKWALLITKSLASTRHQTAGLRRPIN